MFMYMCITIIKEELMYLRGRLGNMERVRYGRRKEGNDANTVLLYENLKKKTETKIISHIHVHRST